MISTKGLHIGYSESLVRVDDLNLSAGLYILIGKNGSGKSTFLKTMSGQIAPIQGEVSIDGRALNTIPNADIPKTIAFVGSHFPVVDFLKVEDFIALGRSPFTNFFGKKTANDQEIMERAIQTLQIDHLRNRFTSELSDGEKQLVSIAKALTQQTPTIALDEPTAFLDYSNKKLVLDNLIQISKEFNKCIILSSHDIDLSLEAKCPFLMVTAQDATLQFQSSDISKEGIITKVFA